MKSGEGAPKVNDSGLHPAFYATAAYQSGECALREIPGDREVPRSLEPNCRYEARLSGLRDTRPIHVHTTCLSRLTLDTTGRL